MLIHADQPEAAPALEPRGNEVERTSQLLAAGSIRALSNAEMSRVVERLASAGSIVRLEAPEMPAIDRDDPAVEANLARWEAACAEMPARGKIPSYKLESADGGGSDPTS